MLTVTPSAKPYIAEIGNIDLSRPLDDTTFGQILDTWKTYPVLVFRDQCLEPDSQQAFAARFGPLASRSRPQSARGKKVQDNPHLMIVTNIHDADGQPLGSGDSEQAFHTDGCFRKITTLATFLYGIEAPAEGGETLFVDMNEIYDALSPKTQARINGRYGVNYHYFGYRTYNDNGGSEKPRSEVIKNAVHPLVIAHPLTNKPVIFANRHNTREIAGMDPAEAKPLLREIFTAIEQPERIYAHKWHQGDLVMWDNRAVQHARAPCAPDQRRMLRRFSAQADEPPHPYRQ